MTSQAVRRMLVSLVAVATLSAAFVASAAENPLASIQLPGKNLANNGGFERGVEGWEWFGGRKHGELVTDVKHGGQTCLKVSGVNEDYRYLNQTPVYLTPGETYTLSAWMKCEGFSRAGEGSQVINLTNYGWTQSANIGPLKPDEDWTHYSVTFQAPPTSEVAGRLSYTLVIFWPIKSEGTVWIDDMQIEKGSQATEYTDSYVGWGIQATETLSRTWERVVGIQETLAEGFGGAEVPAGLLEQVVDVGRRLTDATEKLRGFANLAVAEARELPGQAEALDAESAHLSSIAFLSDPFRPVSELTLPDREPEQLSVDLTCFQGERRAVALTVANLAARATVARVAPGELYDVGRQVRWVGTPWLNAYTAPPIRGHIKTWEQFTDPLPLLGPDGLWTISPGLLNQLVCVVDTSSMLPGEYTGQIEIASITEKALPRTLQFHLQVVPVRLDRLPDIEICDIGMMADYALDSIAPLGINTFSVPAQWALPEYDAQTERATVDFTRISVLVRERLAACPGARFWIGFGVGAVIAGHAERNLGISATDPRFDEYVRGWTRAVVEGFQHLGIGPERLIFETVDEPGAGQMELAARISRLVHAANPQVRTQTYVTSFNADDEACARMYEAHDIIGLIRNSVTDESVAFLREHGKQIWVYDCQNNAESFDPISYYRLLPWLGWRHGLEGWGHFSWLDSMRGRDYVPWEGVAEQALVYPALDGGQVISRRWLAIEAGTTDYRALLTLKRLTDSVQTRALLPPERAARELVEGTPDAALVLARDGREYFTGLQPDADISVLSNFREAAARHAGELFGTLGAAEQRLTATLVTNAERTQVQIVAPGTGLLTARSLCDHRLPWRTVVQAVQAGASSVALPCPAGERVSRCVVEFTGADGLVLTAAPTPIPAISVDSELPPYSADRLNDGLAMPGMKFEPEHGWMSGGAATEHWAAAQLPAPILIRAVHVWWMTFGGLPRAIKVQVGDGAGWKDAPGFEQWRPATAAVEELTFAPLTTDRVRVIQNAGGGNIAFPNLMGLSELEVVPAE